MTLQGDDSARGNAGAAGVAALREKVSVLVASQQQVAQKHEYLRNYFCKWSAGRQRINYNQFFAALQSLSLPLNGASEVFGCMDRDGNGMMDINEFCESMLSGGAKQPPRLPPMPPPGSGGTGGTRSGSNGPARTGSGRLGSAMRSAGNAMVGGGDPYNSQGGGATTPGGRMSARPPSGRPPSGQPPQAVLRQSSGQNTPTMGGTLLPPQSQSMPRRPSVRVNSATSSRPGRTGSAASGRGPSAGPASASRGGPGGGGGGGGGQNTLQALPIADMLVEQFKRAVLQRCGAGGLHSLGRSFRILDDDGSRQVNINELSSGIADLGFHVEMKDLQILLAAVDKNNSGSLSFEEFVVAVRGDVNPRREALINMAFDTLDRTGDGTVQADDICQCYDVRHHPEVQMGVMGEDQALNHFLSQFDSVERDGIVTRREFLEYYRSVSASIDGDDYFELMIRNAWHISGGEGQSQNTANTQVLVTFEDGAQEVVALQHDIGIDLEDPMVVMQHLHAQGVKGAVSYSLGQ